MNPELRNPRTSELPHRQHLYPLRDITVHEKNGRRTRRTPSTPAPSTSTPSTRTPANRTGNLRPLPAVLAGASALAVGAGLFAITSSDPTDAALTSGEAAAAAPTGVLFDDFHYDAHDDPAIGQNGWTVRAGGGGPGVPGAVWDPSNVTFETFGGETVMRLESHTDQSVTEQTEVHHQRKFYEGTYAARVRFTDAPTTGPDGDHIVQTFFTITPLDFPMDPNYGEIDFEYLPNGGWGGNELSMYMTTWDTYNPDPWESVNVHDVIEESFEGWRDLVFTVSNEQVTYYIDGQQVAQHGQPYYPETPMSVNFNLWFIADGLIGSPEYRAYEQDVDWVFHAKDRVLTPAEVQAEVNALRADGVEFVDTV